MNGPVRWTQSAIIQMAAIAVIAVGLRGWIAVTTTRVPLADETSYDESGWSIATGGGYVVDGKVAFKAPLYSAFLAGVYRVCGHDYRAARVAQAALGASLCLLVVWLGGALLGPTEGLLAGWICAVYPPFIWLTRLLLSENLFIWLSVLSLVWLVRYLRSPRISNAVVLGILGGLSALTRPTGLIATVVLAGLILALHRNARSARQRWLGAVLVCTACAATILPWTVRNWTRLHAFVPITSHGGRDLYVSWTWIPDGKRLGFGSLAPEDEQAIQTMGELETEQYLYQQTITYLRRHPQEISRLSALKTLYFWSPFDWEVLGGGQGVYNGAYVFLLPFMLLALIWSAARPPPETQWICAAFIACHFITAVIFCGLPRYRLPIEPILILLASRGLLAFVLVGNQWSASRAGSAVALAGVHAAAAVYSSQVKIMARVTMEWLRLW